jgi:hypothetical protein
LVQARLGRIFVSTKWDAKYPLAKIVGLAKGISDHTPLLVDSGDRRAVGEKRYRFKKWWLEKWEFKDLVLKAWSEKCSSAITLLMDGNTRLVFLGG